VSSRFPQLTPSSALNSIPPFGRLSLAEGDNPRVSKKAMAHSLGISTPAIDKNLAKLKQKGILRRVGPAKGGHWEMIR